MEALIVMISAPLQKKSGAQKGRNRSGNMKVPDR